MLSKNSRLVSMISKLLDTVVIFVDFKSQSRNNGIYPILDGHCQLFFTVTVEKCLFLQLQEYLRPYIYIIFF